MKIRILYTHATIHATQDGCFIDHGEILCYQLVADDGEVLGEGDTEEDARNAAHVELLQRELKKRGLA